jgi:hypothetical protein
LDCSQKKWRDEDDLNLRLKMRPLVGDVTFFEDDGVVLPEYGLKEPSLGNMIRSRSAWSAGFERGRQQKWTRSGYVSD